MPLYKLEWKKIFWILLRHYGGAKFVFFIAAETLKLDMNWARWMLSTCFVHILFVPSPGNGKLKDTSSWSKEGAKSTRIENNWMSTQRRVPIFITFYLNLKFVFVTWPVTLCFGNLYITELFWRAPGKLNMQHLACTLGLDSCTQIIIGLVHPAFNITRCAAVQL